MGLLQQWRDTAYSQQTDKKGTSEILDGLFYDRKRDL